MKTEKLSCEDYMQLERLNHDFAYFVDHNRVEGLLGLFCDDIYYRHDSRVTDGIAAVEKLFSGRSAQGNRVARHVISGLRLDLVAPGKAVGQSVVVTWAANSDIPVRDTTTHLIADFDDEYRLCPDNRWRISRRIITRIFEAPDNPGPIGVSHGR